jgi:hypothetical protein
VPTQLYLDEAGNTVASDWWEPSREVWNPALPLPRAPQGYRCLGYGTLFTALPGANVTCPNCPHPYLACPGPEPGVAS